MTESREAPAGGVTYKHANPRWGDEVLEEQPPAPAKPKRKTKEKVAADA